MKKYFIGILFIFVLNVFSYAQHATPEQRVRNLSEKKFRWMVTQQFDSLERILDPRLQYIHSNGWTQSKKEVIDDFKSKKLVYLQIAVEEMDARVFGNAAVVTGKGKFSGTGSAPFDMELKYTEVYILTRGQWMLVSRHANKLP